MLMNDNAKPRYDARTQIAKLTAITAALEIKDPYTRGHARRVAVYARRLAERIGLNAVEAEKIRLGGLLHDIGKIGLSEQLLNNTRNRLSAQSGHRFCPFSSRKNGWQRLSPWTQELPDTLGCQNNQSG
jgi:putative nucleotidyltransferase with HDIG domain